MDSRVSKAKLAASVGDLSNGDLSHLFHSVSNSYICGFRSGCVIRKLDRFDTGGPFGIRQFCFVFDYM